MSAADTVKVEACETYQKRSYRQRSYLMGPNGLQLLSVPLASGKHSGQAIKEVQISYEHDWVGSMLHTIRSALGSAPYFDYYYPGLAAILRTRYTTLWSLNQAGHRYICESIGLSMQVIETSSFRKSYDNDYRTYDVKPTRTDQPTYEQVWSDRHGHWDNLSVLDILFCLGPEALLQLSDR